MDSILKDRLEILANDEVALKAIRAAFAERIEKEKPVIERTDNDKVLGEKYRAYEQAKNLLNAVLLDIESYNSQKTKSEGFNKSK